MGLAIGVGVLADLIRHDEEGARWIRESIARLNDVLGRHGKQSHHEPEDLPSVSRASCTSFPYSFLHYLRRAFAHVREGRPVPDDDTLQPEHDRVVDDVASMLDSHLLCHSDAEGFYVPMELGEPIFDDALPGTMLGSSQALLRELIEVAPALGIAIEDGRLAEASAVELGELEDGTPLWRERLVWFALYEGATISVTHQTLLVFH